MTKHKVGDKVQIRSLDWYNKNKDVYGIIWGTVCFSRYRTEYCGKIATIIAIEKYGYFKGTYKLDLDNGSMLYCDYMFEDDRRLFNLSNDSIRALLMLVFMAVSIGLVTLLDYYFKPLIGSGINVLIGLLALMYFLHLTINDYEKRE